MEEQYVPPSCCPWWWGGCLTQHVETHEVKCANMWVVIEHNKKQPGMSGNLLCTLSAPDPPTRLL